MSFNVEYNWFEIDPPYPDSAVHQTMAELHIWANDKLVTAVQDDQDQSRNRDHLRVPMSQMAEWVVSNWFFLFHEPSDSGNTQRLGFEDRHNLSYAGNGFVFPPLTIAPTDGAIVMRWEVGHPEFSSIRFARYGEERVPTNEVEDAFRSLVEDTLRKARRGNSPLEDLEDAWQDICNLDEDECEFARAAALIGLDPFEIEDRYADGITEFWQGVPSSIREDALRGMETMQSISTVQKLIIRGLYVLLENEDNKSVARWQDFRSSIQMPRLSTPWERGYRLAEIVTGKLQSLDADMLNVPYRSVHSATKRIQGMVSENYPLCVGTLRTDTSRRFLHARGIAAFMASASSPSPRLISTLTTDFQAYTRAFAAEFLAPAERIRDLIDTHGASISDTAIAQELRVSPYVIKHQIDNHHLR